MLSAPRFKRAGFTLIEVIIGMTVLALVFASSIAALSIGFKMLEEARASTLASQILQSEIENVRLKNWTQISALPASEVFEAALDASITGIPTFSCERTVDDVDSDMKRVGVSISWTTKDGRGRSRSYATYVAKYGLNDYYYRKF